MILLIPFMARRVVSGDVGSTMLAVMGVAAGAVQSAVAGWAGMQAGAASVGGGGEAPAPMPALSGPPTPPPEVGSAAVAGLSETGAGGSTAPSPPVPSNPSHSSGAPGHFGRTSIPHAVGWTVGTWAGATGRAVSSAFRSNQKEEEDFEAMKQEQASALPEKTAYTKYFEHDGALRAYANRMMWFGISAVLISFVLAVSLLYMRVQPPTVIRIAANGEASVVSGATTTPRTALGFLSALGRAYPSRRTTRRHRRPSGGATNSWRTT